MLPTVSMIIFSWKKKFKIEGTVSVFSSDPPCKMRDLHRFPLKLCLITYELDINVFFFYWSSLLREINTSFCVRFFWVPVQRSDPQTLEGTKVGLTNVGLVQTSDWDKRRTGTFIRKNWQLNKVLYFESSTVGV